MRVIHWFVGKGLLYFIKVSIMAVLSGFNFWLAVLRWGWTSQDPVIQVNAVLVAGVTEIGLFVFLLIFSEVFYTKERRKRSLWGWGAAAIACIAVSLYVNINYFDANWHDVQGVQLVDLLVRSVFLMALLVAVSLIPPKVRKVRTAGEVEREYEGKFAEARLKVELKAIENQQAEARRKHREEEDALHKQLARIAGPDLTAQFEVRLHGEFDTDWRGLQSELEARGWWPPQQTALPAAAPRPALPAAHQEPPNTITDGEMVAVSVKPPKGSKRNGHKAEGRDDAAEHRPFPGDTGPKVNPWDGEELE